MGIHQDNGRVTLDGQVTVEDAETLLSVLRATTAPVVDLAACEHIHAAALQVLLALGPTLTAAPADAALRAALAGLSLEATPS